MNRGLKPSEVSLFSHRKVWWKCLGGHEWEATVTDRSAGRGCPFCAGRRVKEGDNDLTTLLPQVAAEWHPTLNEGLLPCHVTLYSNKNVWWKCRSCGQEWKAIINNRTRGSGCPECKNHHTLSEETCLANVNQILASEWHPTKNGSLTPHNVLAFSKKKVWWICENKHEWLATILNRGYGTECPYCSGRKLLRGENDLETRRPELVKEWHAIKNGSLKPSDFAVYSNKSVWWKCSKEHEWQSKINYRSHGAECPECTKRVMHKNTKLI